VVFAWRRGEKPSTMTIAHFRRGLPKGSIPKFAAGIMPKRLRKEGRRENSDSDFNIIADLAITHRFLAAAGPYYPSNLSSCVSITKSDDVSYDKPTKLDKSALLGSSRTRLTGVRRRRRAQYRHYPPPYRGSRLTR